MLDNICQKLLLTFMCYLLCIFCPSLSIGCYAINISISKSDNKNNHNVCKNCSRYNIIFDKPNKLWGIMLVDFINYANRSSISAMDYFAKINFKQNLIKHYGIYCKSYHKYNLGKKYKECFLQAANRYKIPYSILYAIAAIESNFHDSLVNINLNNTFDVGIMQINSIWFKKLVKLGIFPEDVFDPCINIQIGAWILSNNLINAGNNLKIAIGRYNASCKSKQDKYVNLVLQEHIKQKENYIL